VEKPLRLSYYYGETNGTDEKLECPTTIDGLSPFDAARQPNLPIVSAFVYAGFPLETKERGKGEGTLLHNAALTGDVPMMSFLLDVGADINATNGINPDLKESTEGFTFGQTPLFWGAQKGHLDAVNTLFNYGAKPNVVDKAGHLATFSALKHPLVLHILNARGVDVSATDETHRTALHDAAHEGLRTAVQYMVEMVHLDVNVKDAAGNTPLHLAARRNDTTSLKALLQKGADADHPNAVSLTPRDVASPACREFLTAYAGCANSMTREKMLSSDTSTFQYLLAHPKEMLLPALVSLIVPNMIVVGSTALHPILGFLSVLSLGVMMTISAKFQSSTRRSLVTPGWFAGALFTGGGILLTQVFPQYRTVSEHAGFLVGLWVLVSVAMFTSYLRSVFADPGIIPSTAAARADVYNVVAKGGQLDKHDYCITCMIRKPHRSKHCSVTGHCVYRFDHYCVWTGNAVGAGSHRYFYGFLVLQLMSQMIVAYTTFYVMFAVRPYEDGVKTPTSLWEWISFIFLPQNALVTYFLMFYNSLIFMFMFMVLATQTLNVNKNLTSNEAWFASRYRWMFPIGNTAYSLYDHGNIIENWKEFLFGNLRAEHFTIPDMPEFLREKTRQFYAKQGAKGGDHGHSHGGQPCHGHGEAQHSHSHHHGVPSEQQDFQNAVLAATSSLPTEKARELKIMQNVLMQVTSGKTDITLPEDVKDSEREHYLAQVELLRERHKQVMASFAASGAYGGLNASDSASGGDGSKSK
jgi:ankyrin repeat protein